MATRVTEGLLFNKGQEAISRAREKMVKNQEEVSSGKRINKPSDDPVGAMRAIGLKSASQRGEQVSTNLEVASSMLNLTDSTLGELTGLISRAKELAIEMSSSSNADPDAQAAASAEIEQLNLRAVQIGNTRLGDRYIFGGYQTDHPPFDVHGNYFGDAGSMEIESDRGQKIAVNIPGNLPFYGAAELSPAERQIRLQPGHDSEPTLATGLRAPASVKEGDPKKIDSAAPKSEFAQEGVNIFRVLRDLGDGLKRSDLHSSQRAVAELDDSFKQVLSARAIVGARQNILQASQDSLGLAKVSNAEMLSNTEDADSLKVLSDLTKNEHALTATLETSKRLLTPSLLDFIK